MKVIFQNEKETVSAIEIDGGVLVKSVTKNDDGQQSESLIEIKSGVIVNHGTVEEPVWKLNR
jgi:hypothetical protein